MKIILVTDVLVAYPNQNTPFHIYTNASDYQMDAVIIQQKQPVTYWSYELTKLLQDYHTL